MSNNCKYCKKPLIGRSDKLFCDNNCRGAYHNSKANENENSIRDINKILRKNQTILRFASPEGKTTVRKSFLIKHGFNFQYYTNHFKTKNENTYTFCYDYGYMELEDEKVLVINKQPYM